jgi:hypothetical protein
MDTGRPVANQMIVSNALEPISNQHRQLDSKLGPAICLLQNFRREEGRKGTTVPYCPIYKTQAGVRRWPIVD